MALFLFLILGMNLLMLAGFGLAFLFRPEEMAALVDLVPTSTTALSDLRASYGGMALGIVATCVWLWAQQGRRVAQVAMTVVLAGFVLGRGLGFWLDTPTQNATVMMWMLEWGLMLVNVLACRRWLPGEQSTS